MRCKNCGEKFEKGVFCPECGARCIINDEINEKMDSKERNTSVLEKAYSILDEYEEVKLEEEIIKQIGWSNQKDVKERVNLRIQQLHEVEGENFKSEYANQIIKKMKRDIKEDYYELKKKSTNIWTQTIVAIIIMICSISFLFSKGLFGIIIGIILMICGWGAVLETKKENELLNKIKIIMREK